MLPKVVNSFDRFAARAENFVANFKEELTEKEDEKKSVNTQLSPTSYITDEFGNKTHAIVPVEQIEPQEDLLKN